MLKDEYRERSADIRHRLREFRQVPPADHIYELMYCILTPQSSARNAAAVVKELMERDFAGGPFDPEPLLRNPAHYIRFHRTKARRLNRAAEDRGMIEDALANGLSSYQLREWLVDHIDGFGMKEATHFLRNIGRNDGMAILDRHILRHLAWSGVISEVPVSMTKKRYLEIEKKFARFADRMGIPIDELDLLFWSLQTGEILK